jgi:hypothetical protein
MCLITIIYNMKIAVEPLIMLTKLANKFENAKERISCFTNLITPGCGMQSDPGFPTVR